MLNTRVKEDKKELEVLLEKLGLMRVYDQLWDLGVDSLEGLSRVQTEDFNHMMIPAGTQLKIQRELRKAGLHKDQEVKEVGMTADLLMNESE